MLYRNQIYHLFSLNKIPFTNRKKITRQQSDNRQSEFNNENYHRLKIIYVKNQSCQISSSFPQEIHTRIFRIGIFLAALLVFHRVFSCTQQ